QINGRNASEVFELFAKGFGLGGIAKALHFIFIQVRGMLHPDFLCNGNQAVNAKVRHRFMSGLNGLRVEFDPSGVRKFYEPARGSLETLKICRSELEAFLFPFGANRQPIDAAAFDHQTRAETPWREEKAMKGWVPEALSVGRALVPNAGQRAKKIFVRVADPEARLWSEPIEPAQPLCGGLETGVVQNLGFVAWTAFWLV